MTAFVVAKKRAVKRVLFGKAYADLGLGFEYITDGKRRLKLPAFHLNKIYPYSIFPAIGRVVSNRELNFAYQRITRRKIKQLTHR